MKKVLTLLTLGIAVLVSGCVVYPAGRYQYYDGQGYYYRDAPRYDNSRGDRYYWYRDRGRYHDRQFHDGIADG